MKKIIFAIAIVLTFVLTATAQGRIDGFYKDWDDNDDFRDAISTFSLSMPGSAIGSYDNDPAPLGSGLLILTVLGTGYIAARRKQK